MRSIPLFDLNFGSEEESAVIEVLRSKWISMGPKTKEFEDNYARLHQSTYAVAVTNRTAALHLALRICGVGPGDEVIVPSLTFVATASSVRMVGAIPVFADVTSLDDWTICPKDVEKNITSKTKAIIPMHFGGHGADMLRLCTLAERNNLKIIEDACHAPLGKRDGQYLGTFGDFASYSFYSNKNMATGEGGMLLTQNKEYDKRARLLRAHGMTATAYDREQGKEFYDVVDWGYNYRIDDIRAAIGIAQLAKLEEDVSYVKNNHIIAMKVERHSYASSLRSVGIGVGNPSTGVVAEENHTYGLDVGVGPENANQIIPHRVSSHHSVNDVLAVDPRGLIE